MAAGLRAGGLEPSLAFDYSPDACDSYAANLGHRPVQLDVHDLLRLVRTGWRPARAVDLFVADPPCTPWSRAGKRQGRADERDMLDATVELVRLLAPRFFLIANVPGLDDGPNWPVVQETIGGLARDGYCIDFARLDAADYGVPQHRVRPFWFGHGRTTPCVRWPARTHGSPEECATLPLAGVAALRPWVTCREALARLSPADLGTPVRLRWRHSDGASARPRASRADAPAGVITTRENGNGNQLVAGPNHRPSRASAPARTVTRNTHSDGALLVNDRHPINAGDAPSYAVTAKGDGRGAQGACVVAWPWDRPSTTVTTRDAIPPPGHHPESGSVLSQPNAVKLSERAAAILQGVDDSWTFAGKTKAARWSQLGMMMPPPLAAAVARSLARAMGVPALEAAE